MTSTKGPAITPTFTPFNYAQFFGAGALAATLTHGVGYIRIRMYKS